MHHEKNMHMALFKEKTKIRNHFLGYGIINASLISEKDGVSHYIYKLKTTSNFQRTYCSTVQLSCNIFQTIWFQNRAMNCLLEVNLLPVMS